MKKKKTIKIQTTPAAILTCNAIVEEIEIGLDPSGSPNCVVRVKNDVEFKEGMERFKRSFSVPRVLDTRSPAEGLGVEVYALSWCLDRYFSVFESRGQIVRVKHQGDYIVGIGHAIFDRWLSRESRFQPPYPFYTGVPESETKTPT